MQRARCGKAASLVLWSGLPRKGLVYSTMEAAGREIFQPKCSFQKILYNLDYRKLNAPAEESNGLMAADSQRYNGMCWFYGRSYVSAIVLHPCEISKLTVGEAYRFVYAEKREKPIKTTTISKFES